jgi:hypothetical protein
MIAAVFARRGARSLERAYCRHDAGGATSLRVEGHIGVEGMPQFDRQLIQIMKNVLEDIMKSVPLEHSTPAVKAYLAECILKAAAQGHTNYDALMAAAVDQMQELVSLLG